MFSVNYYVLIAKDQDLDLDQLENILKYLSKKYRCILYKKGDFVESINKKGYYVFLTLKCENKLNIKMLSDELNETDIINYLYKKSKLKKVISTISKNKDDMKTFTATFNGKKYEPQENIYRELSNEIQNENSKAYKLTDIAMKKRYQN